MQDISNREKIEYFDNLELGFVDCPITPMTPGRVKCLGSIWPAQFGCGLGKNMESGERVIVIGRVGMALLVMPESECSKCPKEGKDCSRQCLMRVYSLNQNYLGNTNTL